MPNATESFIGSGKHPTRSTHRLDLREISIALVSTYPPTRCGIGRFSRHLLSAWAEVAPNARIGVARIAGPDDAIATDPNVEIVFDPSSPVAVRTAARHVNRSDVVVLQHEFGLYGPDDGIAVLDLVDRIRVPLVTVLHTVLSHPSTSQRQIVQSLAAAGSVVVPTEAARRWLLDVYAVSSGAVHVIPHGSSWSPRPLTPAPRRHLITWGLLGPGKGIERTLHALAALPLDPPVTLDVVGQTHPKVLAQFGQQYRSYLRELAKDLHLGNRVRFVDRYLEDDELLALVAQADLVVVPYDNDTQICSGVLTDAVAAGRPVVATDFPHARELLREGAGLVVPHSVRALARAVELLLGDESAYAFAAGRAADLAGTHTWSAVATRYVDLLQATHRGVSVA